MQCTGTPSFSTKPPALQASFEPDGDKRKRADSGGTDGSAGLAGNSAFAASRGGEEHSNNGDHDDLSDIYWGEWLW